MEVNCENYDSRIKAVFPFLWREALFYFCVSRISLGSIESGTLAVVSGTLGYCTLASVPDTLECSRYFASVLDTSECSGYMQVFQVPCECSGYQRVFWINASVPDTLRVFRIGGYQRVFWIQAFFNYVPDNILQYCKIFY